MKLGPVIKLEKGNTITSKKFEYDIMSTKCDVIIIFPIYGKSEAVWKPDSKCMVCKTYVYINSSLLSYKK